MDWRIHFLAAVFAALLALSVFFLVSWRISSGISQQLQTPVEQTAD